MDGLAAVASAVVSGLFAIAAVAYTARETRRNRKAQQTDEVDIERARLEADAYQRARASYEAALRTAAKTASDMERRMSQVEVRAERAEHAARAAEERATAAEQRAATLGRTLTALRMYLRQQGIAVPAHLDGDGD